MARKVLSKSEIKEFSLEKAVKIIVDASVQLECSIFTRTKALLIYHHFKRCVHEVQYDDYLVAAGCLSLSIKFNEEPVEFDAIILIFFKILGESFTNTNSREKRMQTMQKSLTRMEFLILRMTEFSVNHRFAHEYLTFFMNEFREVATERNLWDALVETSMKLASDFYLSNKCINYKPDEIAAAVMHTSLYLVNFDTNENINLRLKKLNSVTNWSRADLIEEIFRVSSIGPVAEMQQLRITEMEMCMQ